MIYNETLSLEDNERLNNYISALNGKPKIFECERLFEYLRLLVENYGNTIKKFANKINIKILRPAIQYIWGNKQLDIHFRNRAYDLSKKSLFFSARDDFDSFMLYTEIDRPYNEKFWQPRKVSKMKEICKGMQQLADDELDVLFVACPPRIGKSTLGLWFDAWLSAKAAVEKLSKNSILSIGHSAGLVNTFYEEIGTFCSSDKYKFLEVFPELKDNISVSAKYQTINFGDDRRYKSMSFRSADAGISGSVEASLLLHIDDLISGMEEALSPDRLEKKWQTLYGDIRQRRKEGSKILYIGTIWSLMDPQVRFRELLKDDVNYRIKIIELPALNENDESNFDYPGGFSTAHYLSERNGMDNVTWNCIYQQQPIEREGLLFTEDNFDTFSQAELSAHPLSKGSYVDTAWGGKDYVSQPIIYEYDDGLYLADVVFNKSKKDITQPIVASKIKMHKLPYCDFEANNGGDEYADKVKELLSRMNYTCRIKAIKSPNTPNAKLQRIVQFSPEIQKIKILEKKERTPEYQAFITNLLQYNQNGKNKNDDAPDSLSLYFLRKQNKPKPVKVLPPEFRF